MLLTAESPRGPEPVTTPAGEVWLRLRGEGDQERIVRLAGDKSTVGSSPRCTLRIAQPGVAPVHCLIVRRGDSLTVRRWAAGALLNGRPFDDARLSAGDRLSLGPVDLHVLPHPADSADERINEFADGQGIADDRSAGQVCDDEGYSAEDCDIWPAVAAEAVFQRLRLARTLARARSRKLLAALRHQRQFHSEVADRAEHLEQQVQAARAEGEGLRHQLEHTRQELAAAEDRLSVLDSLADEKRTLAADHAELAEVHTRLVDDHSRLVEEHAKLVGDHTRLADDNARLVAGHARLAEEKAALDERVTVALGERQQTIEAIEHLNGQHEQQQADFARERAEWDELRQEWQSRLAGHVRQIEELERQLETLRDDQLVQSSSSPRPAADHLSSTWTTAGHQSTGETPAGAADDARASAAAAGSRGPVAWPAAATAGREPGIQPEAPVPASNVPGLPEGAPQAAGVVGWPADETTGSDLRDSDLAAVREFSLWNRGAAEQPKGADELFDDRSEEGPPRPADEGRGLGAKSAPETPPAQWPAATRQTGPAAAAHLDEGQVVVGRSSAFVPPSSERPPWRAVGQQAPAAPCPAAQSGSGQRPSFIERYAHMFEDDAGKIEPVPEAGPPTGGGSESPALSSTSGAESDAEESIEQYMARLMQRTRGQSSTGAPASTFVPPQPAENRPTTARAQTDSDMPVSRLEERKRAGRELEQSSNLAALRSLANDIARQAIGTYAARKYRRAALTQIIIVILAALTSLYLMVLSSGWWDVRFLSACVSLAASIYYAFLTITTLIDSVRASVFEELEHDLADEDPWHPPLPIDVEHKTSS